MPSSNPIVNAIVQGARQRGLDPQAVLAVARVEGLSGRIGDNGHAYGPFQLNNAGGVITNRYPGAYRQDVQRWASSPEGIAFALDRIAQVARGKSGREAIANIVSRFERPQNIPGEIQRASALYGSGGGAAPPSPAAGAPVAATAARSPLSNPLVAQIVASNDALIGISPPPLELFAQQATANAPAQSAPPVQPKKPRRSGTTIRFLEQFAAPYGLTVTSTTGGKHVKGSYHYRGKAVDFAGDQQRMMALAEAALQHPADFKEVFFDPLGFYVKNGRVYRGAIGGHTDHVHLAAA